ncbi:flavodoxin [Acidaminobacter sp. JC074]|uniref:flavodoxin n=1 Tax=Acidaminobacter sp. JC074 TaxID=2530199 RepID=UPI001F0F3FD6|nr:flavodoxin [Acidaminobacter sp. JC074]MCH4887646.1 flavodoxin [Acidaminobacter sp. JC074]
MKILVVYFSYSGCTEKVAQMIAKEVGADLEKITPVSPYTIDELRNIEHKILNKEHREIQALKSDLRDYDTIIIGTPVYWYTFAPPIRTFLMHNDLSEKRIRLFSTSAAGGGRTYRDMVEMLGNVPPSDYQDFYMGTPYADQVTQATLNNIRQRIHLWFKK